MTSVHHRGQENIHSPVRSDDYHPGAVIGRPRARRDSSSIRTTSTAKITRNVAAPLPRSSRSAKLAPHVPRGRHTSLWTQHVPARRHQQVLSRSRIQRESVTGYVPAYVSRAFARARPTRLRSSTEQPTTSRPASPRRPGHVHSTDRHVADCSVRFGEVAREAADHVRALR